MITMPRLPAQLRRRQLLEVAADRFARSGYRGTTTAELAEAAGVTEPVLYRHFESKLDLFVALLERAGQEYVTSWRVAVESTDDARERLSRLLAGPGGARAAANERVILRAMSESEREPAVATALARCARSFRVFVAEQVADLQRRGALARQGPPDGLARLVIEVVLGSQLLSALGDRSRADSSRELLLALIQRPRERSQESADP